MGPAQTPRPVWLLIRAKGLESYSRGQNATEIFFFLPL
jgi:hypothetical protein